ncbi:MAG: recombinase family protein [Planctomyces sp.]
MPPAASPSGFAIYTRQSVDTAKDFSSCDAQFQTCLDCARAFGDRDGDWIGERFDDQGWSGSSVERPALKRLRQAVREGRVRHVYAVALDRLSRTMRDAVVILDELEAAGVELRLVHQPGVGTSAEGRFLRHIIASFAEFARELIAARLSDTRMSLKAHGRRLAGPPPYGYDADPKSKQLVPNAGEARRLRAIFEMAASGVRPSEIARRINKKRWTTKKRLSTRSGRLIGGGAWTARQIVDVLRNPVCLGVFADKGKLRSGVHAPIIGLDMFVRAKSHLDARTRTPPGKRSSNRFPLRGKVICPGCARPMSSYMVTRKLGPRSGRVYNYYRCRATSGGRPPCRGRQVQAFRIEQAVSSALQQAEPWLRALNLRPTPSQGCAAEDLARGWTSLDYAARARLMPRLIERLEFDEAREELIIVLSPDASGVGSACFAGTSEGDC